MRLTYFGYLLVATALNFSCSPTRPVSKISETSHLKFLDEYDVPYNMEFNNTIIGGLSGMDYNPKQNLYYLISDDRSEKNSARFYTARIVINQNKIDSFLFSDVKFLKNNVGKVYPNFHNDPFRTPDPEAMRYDPRKDILVWSSEGERIVTQNKVVLEDPSVTEINTDGNYIDTFTLPPQLRMHVTESGPRRNGVFEGLTFADNYKTLFVSVEEPLYNDGSRAGLNDSLGIIRIVKFDMATKKSIAQYAYVIDPVAHAPAPPGAFEINGVSDILSLGENRILVIERSFSTGQVGFTVKFYLADLSAADNINDISSLKNNPDVKKASKNLLLNLDDLGFYIDNIEGITFGPILKNGKRSLLLISDNNFNPLQKTQVLLFEID